MLRGIAAHHFAARIRTSKPARRSGAWWAIAGAAGILVACWGPFDSSGNTERADLGIRIALPRLSQLETPPYVGEFSIHFVLVDEKLLDDSLSEESGTERCWYRDRVRNVAQALAENTHESDLPTRYQEQMVLVTDRSATEIRFDSVRRHIRYLLLAYAECFSGSLGWYQAWGATVFTAVDPVTEVFMRLDLECEKVETLLLELYGLELAPGPRLLGGADLVISFDDAQEPEFSFEFGEEELVVDRGALETLSVPVLGKFDSYEWKLNNQVNEQVIVGDEIPTVTIQSVDLDLGRHTVTLIVGVEEDGSWDYFSAEFDFLVVEESGI